MLNFRKVIYISLLSLYALFTNGCEPDNPLRSEELIYSFYGVGPGSDFLREFDGSGQVEGAVSAGLALEGDAVSLDYNAGQYYVLQASPAMLIQLDSNLSVSTAISLSTGDEGDIHFVNATTAIYHAQGSDKFEVVDLFFGKTGETYTLPYIPSSVVAVSSEQSGNRVYLSGTDGQLGYFDIRDYEYSGIANTDVKNSILIDRPLENELYLVGNLGSSFAAIKYDAESGEEKGRSTYEINTQFSEEPLALTGTWGGLNIAYIATSDKIWLLQDFVQNLNLVPTTVSYEEMNISSAQAKSNRLSTGVSILLNGNQSHIISFRDGRFGEAEVIDLSDRIISYEPID